MEIKSEDEEKDWSELYFFVWGNQMKIFVLKTWCKLFSIDLFCKDAKFTRSILSGQLVSCKREIIISKSKFITNLWYIGLLGQRLSHIREWKSREEDNVLKKDVMTAKFHLPLLLQDYYYAVKTKPAALFQWLEPCFAFLSQFELRSPPAQEFLI